MLYRDFATQAEIDAQYDVSAAAHDAEGALARTAELSRGVLAETPPAVHAYGPTIAERLHVLPAAGPAPRAVFVFIHGGYWRAFGAADFACAALGPRAHGIDVVLVDYALAPAVAIEEITRECRAAVAWVHAHAADWGGDPTRIVVGGHSAGGHLTARVLAADWPGAYGLPADLVRGGLPLSGVFDLRPLPYSYLAPALQLSRRTIETESPLLDGVDPAGMRTPRIVSWGAHETSEFVRQSREYAAAGRAAGIDTRELPLPGADHFEAVLEFADPASELTAAVLALAG